jgi:uncharacterized membrane protein
MLRHYVLSLAILVVLDGIWLGLVMGRFYRERLAPIARMRDGALDPVWPVAALVYPVLALGLTMFVLARARTPAEALVLGALFGAITYAVYDLTNHATLRGWTTGLTLVDIGWGTCSCGLAAWMAAMVAARAT